jgi:hypothetical protein
MRPLMFDSKQSAAIAAAVSRALAHPIPWAVLQKAIPKNQGPLMRLEDRGPDHKRPQAEIVEIPVGFRLNISCEEQPGGMCLHLSMSVDRANVLPNPAAIEFVSGVCLGAAYADTRDAPRTPVAEWVEEFLLDDQPGGLAVNRLYLLNERAAGHA